MGKTLTIVAGGVVTIGIVTALFLPGRQTAQGFTAAGNAGANLLGTAIKG